MMKWPYAFATPYGVTGPSGVDSVCGVSAGSPKISLDEAWYTRIDASTARIASSSDVTPTAANSAVSTGYSHERGTNDGEARLYTSRGACSRRTSTGAVPARRT